MTTATGVILNGTTYSILNESGPTILYVAGKLHRNSRYKMSNSKEGDGIHILIIAQLISVCKLKHNPLLNQNVVYVGIMHAWLSYGSCILTNNYTNIHTIQ